MSAVKVLAKRSYVRAMHGLGAILRSIGLLGVLDRRRDRRWAHWLRSLFAIYDVDQMIALDVPWWTYKAIDQVDAFLKTRPDAKVFEYGSGASTVWLARRAAVVHSVEHDKGWFDLMQTRIAGYQGIVLSHVSADRALSDDPRYHSAKEGYAGQSFAAYASAITQSDDPYDLIVIDGRARAACLYQAASYLAEGGMIVFDNSKRQRYDVAIRQSGLTVTPLAGWTPSLPYPDQTTLLQRTTARAADG